MLKIFTTCIVLFLVIVVCNHLYFTGKANRLSEYIGKKVKIVHINSTDLGAIEYDVKWDNCTATIMEHSTQFSYSKLPICQE